jgi:hypothetical protein
MTESPLSPPLGGLLIFKIHKISELSREIFHLAATRLRQIIYMCISRHGSINYYILQYFIKGYLHEIFNPRFFHQSTLPRALIHGLHPFNNWRRIQRENRKYLNFRGVIDPTEIGFKKPLPWFVSMPSQTFNDLWKGYSSELLFLWWLNRFPRGQWLCWNGDLHDPAEI